MFHRCLDSGDCIDITLVTNLDENDLFEGNIFGSSSFGVLVKELVFPYSIFSIELKVHILVSWPVKKIKDLNIGSILCVEITQQSENLDIKTNQHHNNKFVGKKGESNPLVFFKATLYC